MAFGKLFVISAPSGSGKTSLINKVLEDFKEKYSLSRTITYTTRPPREKEIDGQHYHFISVDEFKEKIDQNFFIEWSTWYDYHYGSPVSTLKAIQEGKSYIMILDRLGAKDVLQTYPQTILIWIEPPSIEELEKRLLARGDSEGIIQNRLRKAAVEMQQEKDEQSYEYHIINDDFQTAIVELKRIFEEKIKN